VSAPLPAKVIGGVLMAAALAGGVAVALFPSAVSRQAAVVPPERADTQWTKPATVASAASGVAPDSAPLPSPPERETVPSPLDSAATDSAYGSCVMRVKELLSDAARDSSEVEITAFTGVRPEAYHGPDSLIVEGTAHGRDATPAVWHCAVTANRLRGIGKLTAVVEDGWPGVPAGFDVAHAVTLAAENACLEQTKSVYREYEFRGVRAYRDIDTLHVTGEAIPLNNEDLAGDFHCRAVVRNGRVVSTQAKAER
jgi:hypothetical protein